MILHIFSVLEWTNSNQVLRITWLNRKSTIFFDTYLVLLLLHDGYCLLNARRIHTKAIQMSGATLREPKCKKGLHFLSICMYMFWVDQWRKHFV